MDEKLEKALEFSNFRHTLFLEKIRLQEKLKSDLCYAHNGGQFYIDKAFIAQLNVFASNDTTSLVLLDDKLNPIKIENIHDFIADVLATYNTAVNKYAEEFEELRTKRTVKALVDLNE